VRELEPGLWHWKAPHPQWRPSEPWDQAVSSYAIDDGIVAGDTLVDFDRGLEVNPRWLRLYMTWQQVVDGLRPLLEKPVEHLLATHGGPFDRAALERALCLS